MRPLQHPGVPVRQLEHLLRGAVAAGHDLDVPVALAARHAQALALLAVQPHRPRALGRQREPRPLLVAGRQGEVRAPGLRAAEAGAHGLLQPQDADAAAGSLQGRLPRLRVPDVAVAAAPVAVRVVLVRVASPPLLLTPGVSHELPAVLREPLHLEVLGHLLDLAGWSARWPDGTAPSPRQRHEGEAEGPQGDLHHGLHGTGGPALERELARLRSLLHKLVFMLRCSHWHK
mmetsp:Transcript_36859/g.106267  ORF Transcript_36859/g.106267 Transcript_36859/m.106267 type:complete len:231 (-) Transcript_36859:47-739(-)